MGKYYHYFVLTRQGKNQLKGSTYRTLPPTVMDWNYYC